MNDKMGDLLKLYENTLATTGIVRSEATVGSELTKNSRLAHARWMIDQMLHPLDGKMKIKVDDEKIANRWLGFIQGVLWSENVFSIQALRDQSRGLGENVG